MGMYSEKSIFTHQTLKRPVNMLTTCRASLCVGAFEYVAPEGMKEEILLVLAGYYLKFQKLVVREIKESFWGNPWGFQPIKVYSHDNMRAINFGYHIQEFNQFLNENFNIHFSAIQIQSNDLFMFLWEAFQQKEVVILDIDEMYNPYSVKHYNKTSNLHAIMVKTLDISNSKVELVDTEFDKPYWIDLSSLVEAFQGVAYVMTTEHFYSKLNYEDVYKRFIKNYVDNSTHMHLISFLNEILYLVKFQGEQFVFNGLNFSIAYQIIPYLTMRRNVIRSKLDRQSPTCKELLESTEKWRAIGFCLMKAVLTEMYKKEDCSMLIEAVVGTIETEERLHSLL